MTDGEMINEIQDLAYIAGFGNSSIEIYYDDNEGHIVVDCLDADGYVFFRQIGPVRYALEWALKELEFMVEAV